jgi:hypothetical protein
MRAAPGKRDLTGLVFGRLTVIKFFKHDPRWNRIWKCACTCGKPHYARTGHLNAGGVRSCGCLKLETLAKYRRKPHDLAFCRFGKLLALQVEGHGRSRRWLCECDCGRLIRVHTFALTMGKSQSCGCGRKPGSLTSLHRGMMRRCYDKKATGYSEYGAKGVTVCARWKVFKLFTRDMAPRPTGTSLSRKYDSGGYWCGCCSECVKLGHSRNVEWATPQEQGRQRRMKNSLKQKAA